MLATFSAVMGDFIGLRQILCYQQGRGPGRCVWLDGNIGRPGGGSIGADYVVTFH